MSTPQITDSHCHLDFPDFDDERPEIIARALDAGVRRMVTICTRLRLEPQVRAIAEAFDPVFYAAGTHPMSAADEPLATVDQLVALAKHPKFVGIGETGLDYHYTAESAGVQKDSLRVHIEAAQDTGLPLIIHARAADDDMARILTEGFRAQPYTCVMHCFSSSAALARTALDLGFYLSMSGIAAFPKARSCATSLPPRRWTGFWWKPTARILRPHHTGANAMNRPIPRIPRGSVQMCSDWIMRISPRRARPISNACSTRSPSTSLFRAFTSRLHRLS